MNLLEKSAEIYEENVVTPIAPSVTRWTAHKRACKSIIKGFRQFVSSLVVCYNERKEPEALGLLLLLYKPTILATILMLLEVFECTAPLGLALQKGAGTLCLSDIPTYVELTISQLVFAKETKKWMTCEKFEELRNSAEEEILTLPVTARVRSADNFCWESFMTKTFYPFIDRFIEEIKDAFSQLEFWVNFEIFDPRKLPSLKENLAPYGQKELTQLLSHYGVAKNDVFNGNEVHAKADIDCNKTIAEWQGFKAVMFHKREAYYHSIDKKIAAVESPSMEGKELVMQLKKERSIFTPKMLWESFSHDDPMKQLYPSMFFLLYMINIFPLSAACVERLFSKMKLMKTRLRNQLAQVRLDQLLRIGTESPKEGFNDNIYEYFVDELKKRNPKMRIEL